MWVIAALMMPLTLGGVAAVNGRPERASSADFFEEPAPPGDVAMVQTIKRHTPPIFPCVFHSNFLFLQKKIDYTLLPFTSE